MAYALLANQEGLIVILVVRMPESDRRYWAIHQ